MFFLKYKRSRCGQDSMVVGFTTTSTYASSAYHDESCEFESIHGEVYSIQQDIARYVVLRISPLKNYKSHGKQEVDVQ